jgi:hypothetical protein
MKLNKNQHTLESFTKNRRYISTLSANFKRQISVSAHMAVRIHPSSTHVQKEDISVLRMLTSYRSSAPSKF